MRILLLAVCVALSACGSDVESYSKASGAAQGGSGSAAGGAGSTGSNGIGTGGSSMSGSITTSAASGTSIASGSMTSGGTGCDYPTIDNPPGCPRRYSFEFNGTPCDMLGLECWYPGVGDGLPDGCNATALLKCTNDFSDAGAPAWVAAQ